MSAKASHYGMTTEQEFRNILDEHAGILTKVCRLYTDNPEDFRDYYQEVAIQLWRSYQNFRGESQFSTWIYRVALNVCLSLFKKQKKRESKTLLGITYEPAEYAKDDETEERIGKLYKAIKQLREIDRALILLYLEDKSYKEISEIMGMTVTNVGAKLNRIKQQIKQKIHG